MKKSTLLYIYVSLLFILFFDLWVENSEQASNFFGSWIQPYIDKPRFSLVWTILILVGVFVLFKYILDAKDGEMRDLEKTLESEMGILVKANKELNHYRLQDNLMMILNRFVHQNPYVNAAQWYHYGEKNYQGQTKFKMTFQYGEVTEGVTLNAVQQVYYQCSTSTLKKFRKAKRSYTEDSNPDQLVDFIIEVHNEITLKDKLTKEDAILCSLMLLSFEILEKDFGLVFEDLYGPNIGRFQEVIDNNRTGLLRAGLME